MNVEIGSDEVFYSSSASPKYTENLYINYDNNKNIDNSDTSNYIKIKYLEDTEYSKLSQKKIYSKSNDTERVNRVNRVIIDNINKSKNDAIDNIDVYVDEKDNIITECKFPITLKNDTNLYRSLTHYETKEIRELKNSNYFKQIYYLPDNLKTNYSKLFCDNDGYYKYTVDDHIFYRYRIIGLLGKGTYGSVLKCYDYKYDEFCAVKMTRNKDRFINSYKKEVKILTHLLKSKNEYKKISNTVSELVTIIYSNIYWRDQGSIVLKCYEKNLYTAKLNRLKFDEIKIILIDIAEGLNFLKENNVIHCDLKPENIFFINKKKFNVVLADFGLSIRSSKKQIEFNTQTAWYRAPEIIFETPYSYEIDMWSFGAIIVELLTDTAIFRAQNNYELYYLFENYLDVDDNIIKSKNKFLIKYYNEYLSKNENKQRILKLNYNIKNIKRLISERTNIYINFLLDRILLMDPNKRMSPKDVVNYLVNIKESIV